MNNLQAPTPSVPQQISTNYVPPAYQSQEFKPSRLTYRLSALLVDSIILGIPSLVMLVIGLISPPPIMSNLSLVTSLLFICYYTYCHANKGATIGKNVYWLKVVKYKTNELLTFPQAFLRETVKQGVILIPIIGGLIYIVNAFITAFSSEKRGIHDRVAHSQVIEVKQTWSLGKQVLYFLPLLIIDGLLLIIITLIIFSRLTGIK